MRAASVADFSFGSAGDTRARSSREDSYKIMGGMRSLHELRVKAAAADNNASKLLKIGSTQGRS